VDCRYRPHQAELHDLREGTEALHPRIIVHATVPGGEMIDVLNWMLEHWIFTFALSWLVVLPIAAVLRGAK
jgi:hypothetical protein